MLSRLLRSIYSLAVVIMYISLAILLVAIAWPGTRPASTGLLCVVFLSTLSLICQVWLHVSTKLLGDGERARYCAALAGLATLSANFAPILCVLMLGVQIGLDIAVIDIVVVKAYMQLSCVSLLLFIIVTVITPLALGAKLTLDTRSGQEELLVPKHRAVGLTIIRWIIKAAIFWSTLRLGTYLWTLAPQTFLTDQSNEVSLLRLQEPTPWCQRAPARGLAVVVAAYFLSYLALSALMALKVSTKVQASVVAGVKELAILCPMLGAFLAQWWFCSQW
mmetsp:Transcript_59981/g.130106  ORF Transcript_59981/g.130106 Transcript_59981/m.130106 type:complete len:277 (+) Transcript_59981:20-850(+)